jgi:hypothetical protein
MPRGKQAIHQLKTDEFTGKFTWMALKSVKISPHESFLYECHAPSDDGAAFPACGMDAEEGRSGCWRVGLLRAPSAQFTSLIVQGGMGR